MPKVAKSDKRIKKENYWVRLQRLVATYKNACFVDGNNVSSRQICHIRAKLRAIGAVMVMGKNTLMKAALNDAKRKPEEGDSDYEERKKTYVPNPNIDLILPQLRGNINIIFTNGDLSEVKAVLDSEVRPSPAKAGMIAPDSVSVPAGPTGLDPKQTSFFQKLQINTKIVKAQIEIVAAKQVIQAGDKIDGTQALLLDKLKIYPFSYKMNIVKILQDGAIFDAKVLSLTTSTILSKFKNATKLQAQFSLAAGYPTSASAPHSLLNAFKNLVAVSASTDYSFE
jgi:large subunit ribosomal protein LP0